MYGAKLKAIRQLRDFTQEFVARKAGIKQNVYCQIEKDEIVKIPPDTLEKIAEALSVTVEDIKNPMPVVVSLNQSRNSSVNTLPDNAITSKVIEEFSRQLQAKDEQINKLIQIITPKKNE
jgi:transcriptional regulator with XRE-family HTH domain